MLDHLANGLGGTVRALGDRIDDCRMVATRSGSAGGAVDGSELLASVLVIRRILPEPATSWPRSHRGARPSSRETTQPYLRDIGNRLDGFVADLAFSRDVLDEALRLAEAAAGTHGGDGRLEVATRDERGIARCSRSGARPTASSGAARTGVAASRARA